MLVALADLTSRRPVGAAGRQMLPRQIESDKSRDAVRRTCSGYGNVCTLPVLFGKQTLDCCAKGSRSGPHENGWGRRSKESRIPRGKISDATGHVEQEVMPAIS